MGTIKKRIVLIMVMLQLLCFSGILWAFDQAHLNKLLTSMDCSGCDLSNANLINMDLSNMNLSNANSPVPILQAQTSGIQTFPMQT